ncbi:Heatr9 [Bugula neritina]|uniref:Heatr9 n=1 Tax=Bugula neritina TaxID=10212 RepID=A0A7J7JUV1_BUGNE|nr:Heatr9 [Bugula neritina]
MPSSPSKVAINRYNRLPSIEGLTEKPAPISSGKPLKERVKICYRSDLYMAEQRKNVVLFQEQLRQALSDLKTAKPDSLQFHTSRVKELKVKADEMIIILQVAIRSCNLF